MHAPVENTVLTAPDEQGNGVTNPFRPPDMARHSPLPAASRRQHVSERGAADLDGEGLHGVGDRRHGPHPHDSATRCTRWRVCAWTASVTGDVATAVALSHRAKRASVAIILVLCVVIALVPLW